MNKWLFNEWEQGKNNAHSGCNTRVDCRCRLCLHMLPTYYQYFFVGIAPLFLVASLPESPKKALPHLLAKMIESQLLSRIWWGAIARTNSWHRCQATSGIEGSKVMFKPEKWAFKQRTWRCQEQIWKSSRKIWGYMGMFFTMTSCLSMATISNTTTPMIFKH